MSKIPPHSTLLRATRALQALLFLALCTAAGSAFAAAPAGGTLDGVWRDPGQEAGKKVVFFFHREEMGSGRIRVSRDDSGEHFVGSYLRLTGKRPASVVRVFYTAWVRDEFDVFSVGPAGSPLLGRNFGFEAFRERYSGGVVATLSGERGGRMRCHFQLRDAEGGLAGGASGQCQVGDGSTVEIP